MTGVLPVKDFGWVRGFRRVWVGSKTRCRKCLERVFEDSELVFGNLERFFEGLKKVLEGLGFVQFVGLILTL